MSKKRSSILNIKNTIIILRRKVIFSQFQKTKFKDCIMLFSTKCYRDTTYEGLNFKKIKENRFIFYHKKRAIVRNKNKTKMLKLSHIDCIVETKHLLSLTSYMY